MRKILSDLHEVAHFWANNVQPEGGNAGDTFSFNNGVLYSYATPIALRLDSVTLFLDESFSVTTSKHQSYAYSAIHGAVLHVANLGVNHYGWGDSGDKRTMHSDNLAHYKDKIKIALVKASRARKYADMYMMQVENFVTAYNDYLQIFKIRRKAITAADFNIDALLDKANKQRAAQLAAKKKRDAKILLENLGNIKSWIAGERHSLPWGVTKCYLRLNAEKDIIETSRGANIPTSFAGILWKLVKRCVKNNKPFTPKYNHAVKLGHYTLDNISAKGNVKIGCHTIDFDELDRMSHVLGYA